LDIFRCNKDPTGPLNRDSLITHINEEGIKAPVKEEKVPFEPGKKRGKVYVPKYSEAEMEAIRRSEAVAEAVRLDDDEEAALGTATVDDLVNDQYWHSFMAALPHVISALLFYTTLDCENEYNQQQWILALKNII
jgi:hypothetical protein